MSTGLLEKLTWSKMVDLFSSARQSLHIALPGIDEEVATALLQASEANGINIFVCVDAGEDSIRNGYGEEKGIVQICNHPNIHLREYPGNKVSFILVDGRGYIMFPESRIFSADPTGPNAVSVDAILATRLISHFFQADAPSQQALFHSLLQAADQEKDELLNLAVTEAKSGNITASHSFDKNAFSAVQDALKLNPPLEPDLQRQIKTYTAKIQFVEMKFSGISLKTRIVNIPEDALPMENSELKSSLLTKMKLFQNFDENPAFNILKDIKAREQQLREDYLTAITCREKKSIIKIADKEAFKNRLQKIKDEISQLNNTLPEIVTEALLASKRLIKSELLKFYSDNPPSFIARLNNPITKAESTSDFVGDVMRKISFPTADKIVDAIFIKEYFYDLTIQDFSDTELLKELERKAILHKKDIQDIVDMHNAFATKKSQ